MNVLETNLTHRRSLLAKSVATQTGMGIETAERFVGLAAHDLVASLRWHLATRRHLRLDEPATVRDVLSTMGAGRIGESVGLPPAQVWQGLRTFVPHALGLVEPAPTVPVSASGPATWTRASRVPA